jgi:transcriptional regulator with XRE-family HTH domain
LHCTLDFLAAEERVSRDVKSPAKRGWFRPIGEQVNNISLADLARHSRLLCQIRCYERDEMTPSIDAAKKLAKILDTSVGYLLGENDEANLFKDPKMLQRFQDISVLPEKEKTLVLKMITAYIRDFNTQQAYAS